VRSTYLANSTSTPVIVQVVCLSTETAQLNVTRTVETYYSTIQTLFVEKATVTVTMPAAVVYVTSSATVERCQAFRENVVATGTVTLPFFLYVEAQQAAQTREPRTDFSNRSLLVLAAVLISLSLAAALFLSTKRRWLKISKSQVLSSS